MASWLTATLARRLFLLIWGALVLSHLLAWGAVQLVYFSAAPGPALRGGPLPTFPSLPPTPGLDAPRLPPPPPHALPKDGPQQPPLLRRPGGLPFDILLLDYGVRLLVIALAAWYGSRWLARPMRRLVDASQSLGMALNQDLSPPELDEAQGTREVRETAKVFNAMARQLRQQFRARSLMVAAISHDLRTPLTRLRMRLELMDSEPDAREGRELRARSVADVREMNALIDNVLEVFRGDAHAEPAQKTDIGALLQSLADDLVEQGQPVVFEAPGAAAVTLARPDALRRVLGNLLANALRYGGSADIAIAQSDAEIRITIDDTGPGIPAAQLDEVFEPFFRLEASRSQHTGGTGLGLFIARDLTQRQGGRLSLSNRPEGGLRAELVLPRR
ncbi:ATP-binding protein [Roseateles violae]|uniref:histidine kinase n=1 Tax=Roseateles violae TaxID=3058042 RepID=A0ABT8DKW6_9BURK|nr:ATP-binding protein [Pelomonas sp. PFR6]MDN3919055.1 ATP-binding protein [Pelomonas sp. PFR6]